MGVFLTLSSGQCRKFSLPHARGGVSIKRVLRACCEQSSPRPWGCFSRGFSPPPRTNVFPTPVGVFLWRTKKPPQEGGLPHARGGVSYPVLRAVCTFRSSPRPWGCFADMSTVAIMAWVFPTPVGVFLQQGDIEKKLSRLPHARGGVSKFCAS